MDTDPREVVNAYWQLLWAERDLDQVDNLIADGYVRHGRTGSVRRTRAEVRKDMTRFSQTVYGAEVTIEDQALSGDIVWTRLTLRGVNVETEQVVVVSWLHVAKVVEGRIAESWNLNAPVEWTKPPR